MIAHSIRRTLLLHGQAETQTPLIFGRGFSTCYKLFINSFNGFSTEFSPENFNLFTLKVFNIQHSTNSTFYQHIFNKFSPRKSPKNSRKTSISTVSTVSTTTTIFLILTYLLFCAYKCALIHGRGRENWTRKNTPEKRSQRPGTFTGYSFTT